MISFSGNLRAFVCNKPTHMGSSFNALAGLVRNTMNQEPTDPALYLFFNKRRDMVKILYWDRTGYAIWSKRLEEGVFGASDYVLDYASLVILLEGVIADPNKRMKRFNKEVIRKSA